MNEFGDTPRSARQRRKYFRHLLHKCLAPAFDVAASPTAQPQLQRHVRALDWKVLKSPLTPAVPVRRLFSAARANAGTSPNCSDNPTTADPVDTQNTSARPRRQPRFCLHPAGYRPRRSRSRRPASTRFEAEPAKRLPTRFERALEPAKVPTARSGDPVPLDGKGVRADQILIGAARHGAHRVLNQDRFAMRRSKPSRI